MDQVQYYEYVEGRIVRRDTLEEADYVDAVDYAKLEAEAQALREEVAQQKLLTKVENDALKMMTDKANELNSEVEQLEEELESLRARVVVVPERKAPQWGTDYGNEWNACLEELARLNGKTVSEGGIFAAVQAVRDRYPVEVFPADGTSQDSRAAAMARVVCTAIEQELRALLDEGKES